MIQWAVVYLLVGLSLFSCRMARVGKDLPNDAPAPASSRSESKPPMIQPQRVSLPGYAQSIDMSFNDKHELIGPMAIRLDYMPPARPDGLSQPSCYQAIASQLVIGVIECAGSPTLTLEVTAGHLDQVCYTQSKTPRVASIEKIKLPPCVGAALFKTYHYQPNLRVDVIE
jgi:hypothetical protein